MSGSEEWIGTMDIRVMQMQADWYRYRIGKYLPGTRKIKRFVPIAWL